MFCVPTPDADGKGQADPGRGGLPRTARAILDPRFRNGVTGFNFLTSLAGLTDHVPVALSVETDFS